MGGYAQTITILHGGGGALGTPKSDYVICARPLKNPHCRSFFKKFFPTRKDLIVSVGQVEPPSYVAVTKPPAYCSAPVSWIWPAALMMSNTMIMVNDHDDHLDQQLGRMLSTELETSRWTTSTPRTLPAWRQVAFIVGLFETIRSYFLQNFGL